MPQELVKKHYMRKIKADTWKNTFCLLFLSFMICSIMHSYINPAIDSIMPNKTVTLKVLDTQSGNHEIWLADDSAGYNLFQTFYLDADLKQWEYRDATEYQYSENMLVSYGENVGDSIIFSAPIKSNAYILFWNHPLGGKVLIQVDDKEYTIDTYSETGEFSRFYPFQESYLPFIARMITYFILIIAVFLVLTYIYGYIRHKRKPSALSTVRFKAWYILPLWIALFAYAVVQYRRGIPNYLVLGDDIYYWSLDLFNEGTIFNIFSPEWGQYVATKIFAARGYCCHLFSSLAHMAGRWTNIDAIYFYFIATSAAFACLVGYIFPELYYLIRGKKASILQVGISLIIVLFFWNGMLTAVLADMISSIAYLLGIVMFVKGIKSRKARYALVAGASISFAINCRTAFQYAIYLVIVGWIVFKIYKYITCTDKNKSVITALKSEKVIFQASLIALLSFIIVAFPQYQINKAKEHIGLFPFDYEGAWALGNDPDDTTLLEFHTNGALRTAYTGYPIQVADDQMRTIKNDVFNHEDFLQVPQTLRVYANSPLESMQYLVKKIVLAFDIKTSVAYPNEINWRQTSGMLFSFLNYAVLISAVYGMVRRKCQNKIEILIFLVLFIGLVLPEMILTIEWRYFLPMYLFLYYLFVYNFFDLDGAQVEMGSKRTCLAQNNYLMVLTIGIFVLFLISFSVFA